MDVFCLDVSPVLDDLDPADWVGDKGYVGRGIHTPIKKPAHRALLDWEKEFNKKINKLRTTIEHVIVHFKNKGVLHTDYQRPYRTFKNTISTVIALHCWATV